MKKIHLAEFANDFIYCWNAAGAHLQKQGKGALNWLKSELTPPFLEHFSFRFGNQLFFVRVVDADNAVESPGTLEGLYSVANGFNGRACLMYMRRKGDEWMCVARGWGLLDAITEQEINPEALISDEKFVMTDWELQDFAVQVVRDDLKRQNKQIISWQSNPYVDPAIWFVGNTGPEWIVVRVARWPERDVAAPENIDEIANQFSISGDAGHFAVVGVANANDPFDPDAKSNGNFLPLIRSEPIFSNYKGFKTVYDRSELRYAPSTDLGYDLIQEYVNWLGAFLEKIGMMPKMFSGVNRDGSQFIIDLSSLNMEVGRHLDFMRYVLHREGSIAFVFNMHVAAHLSKEPLVIQELYDFFSGSAESYHHIEVASNSEDGWQDGYRIIKEHSSHKPSVFFQELLPQYFKREGDLLEFANIWESMRDSIFWRKRSH